MLGGACAVRRDRISLRHAPRCAAREVGRRQLAAEEAAVASASAVAASSLSSSRWRRSARSASSRAASTCRNDSESARTFVVDVLFADSPERVERVFSRHDALILAH